MTPRPLPAPTAQTNPFLKALLIIAIVCLAGGAVSALTGIQNPEYYGVSPVDPAAHFAVAGILAGIGVTVMLVWLHAAAVSWKPKS